MSKLCYKLFRERKDGSLGPLFINQRQRIEPGTWLQAEAHRKKGFAFRPGWHCCLEPRAPHLSETGRVWCTVLVEDYQLYDRPANQGGTWVLAQRLKLIGRLSDVG